MRPQANWQFLLLSQITRGTFMLHPMQALGMGDQINQLINGDQSLNRLPERAEFNIRAMSPSAAIGSYESSYDGVAKDSTAIFSIHGTMLKYGTWCDYGTMEIANFVREAVYHKNIGSIVYDFDSGGGSVSAIAPLLQVAEEAKALGKPIVSSVDLLASAALYTAAGSGQIIASNKISSEVGSIGVMLSFTDVIPYYEKEGYKFHEIYSSHSNNKNEAFQLALKGDYELIRKEMLDPLALEFQNHIKSSRAGKLDESVPGILNGKTFYATDALKHGLIDDIGPLDMAIERAQQLAEAIKFSNNN
ncbi:MAG: S49 family peptidase [Cyclobacteriaceae bacterium]